MSNPTTTQKNAHQLWCDLFTEHVGKIIYPLKISRGPERFQSAKAIQKEICLLALEMVVHIETTRIRVLTDDMIALADATTKRQEEIKAEWKATHWIRFAKRRNLVRQNKDQGILQEAYKKAILVLVNTPPPPVETPESRRAAMKADKSCAHCEGTGYKDAKMAAAGLASTVCDHCNGTGQEPPIYKE